MDTAQMTNTVRTNRNLRGGGGDIARCGGNPAGVGTELRPG